MAQVVGRVEHGRDGKEIPNSGRSISQCFAHGQRRLQFVGTKYVPEWKRVSQWLNVGRLKLLELIDVAEDRRELLRRCGEIALGNVEASEFGDLSDLLEIHR